jgi:hypothetical protein
MDQQLAAEVSAWIADDPDLKTAAQLQSLLDAGNEIWNCWITWPNWPGSFMYE